MRNGMRLVLINREDERPGALRLRLHDAEAGQRAVAILKAAGCRRLGLASSGVGTASIVERERGFREAAQAAGIDWIEERFGPTGYETGQNLGMALLARADRPDGIFCTTDLLACGVMDAARWQLGIRVPDELSLIGYDNIAQAGWDSYGLTTFSQPIEDMAAQSVAWLSAAAEDDDAGQGDPAAIAELVFAPRLVLRKSVAQGFVPGPAA